ncbi:hypothetical protein, partial [Pyramidobacter piscolens]|uniref:hypothetical protein n=1 Tax=Pyramidobacter piscolens TaxID=638849 RepID=UPI001E5684A2
ASDPAPDNLVNLVHKYTLLCIIIKISRRITFFGSFFPQVFVRMDPLPSQILPLLSQDIPEALFEAYFKFL